MGEALLQTKLTILNCTYMGYCVGKLILVLAMDINDFLFMLLQVSSK